MVGESSKILAAIAQLRLSDTTSTVLMRELYESLRQICEAVSVLKGYKIYSHEAITAFLSEILDEKELAAHFDRYRKIRNSINYYGESVSLEEVKKALIQIPKLIGALRKKHLLNI